MFDPKLSELCRTDDRYAYEAYEFVLDSLGFTAERLGRAPQESDDQDTDYHIAGDELVEGVCALAVQEFGLMAACVFRAWGVHKTDDIGAIVFNLVKAEKISPSDRDNPDDFIDLFDLDDHLAGRFEITLARPKKGYR